MATGTESDKTEMAQAGVMGESGDGIQGKTGNKPGEAEIVPAHTTASFNPCAGQRQWQGKAGLRLFLQSLR
jgi:hypothetical protein